MLRTDGARRVKHPHHHYHRLAVLEVPEFAEAPVTSRSSRRRGARRRARAGPPRRWRRGRAARRAGRRDRALRRSSQNRSIAAPPRTYHVGSARGTVMTARAELEAMIALVRSPRFCPPRQSARWPMTSGRPSSSRAPSLPGPSPGCARPCPLRGRRARASAARRASLVHGREEEAQPVRLGEHLGRPRRCARARDDVQSRALALDAAREASARTVGRRSALGRARCGGSTARRDTASCSGAMPASSCVPSSQRRHVVRTSALGEELAPRRACATEAAAHARVEQRRAEGHVAAAQCATSIVDVRSGTR